MKPYVKIIFKHIKKQGENIITYQTDFFKSVIKTVFENG